MLPRAAGDDDEETREGEMGLDLLGLGLLPPTTTVGHGAGGPVAQRRRRPCYEKQTAFVDGEPLSFAAATTEMRRLQPVDVDDGVVVVPARAPPPASMLLKPAASSSSTTARWPAAHATSPPKLGSFRGVAFQVPSATTTSTPASASSDLTDGGHGGRAHAAVATPTRASPLMRRAPIFVGSSRPPPPVAAAGLIFEGSGSAAAAARSSSTTHGDSTAPMTITYAGSVRAYGGAVTMENAEKILAMVAKEAHAAGIGIGILPVVQQAEPPQFLEELVAAAPTAATGSAAQMAMHWGLAHHVNDSLKRTASLARFLEKRKQRQAESSAGTMLHHPRREREEWFPAQILDDAPVATVSARTSSSLGGMDRRPGASQDHPKRMKVCHAQEAVSTELKI